MKTMVKSVYHLMFLKKIPASLWLSEAERNKEERCSFSSGNSSFPALQRGGLGQDLTSFLTTVFTAFFTCFLGAVETCRRFFNSPLSGYWTIKGFSKNDSG